MAGRRAGRGRGAAARRLISGGDPLSLSEDKLDWILGKLRAIPHIEFIRIGTKMPAVLPHRAIAVGERWQREMPIPSAGPIGSAGNAQVRAEFRLDSLSGNGAVAFVSMRGQIASDSGARNVELSGSMSGAMQIDRVRGWMTDSYFTLLIRSIVTPPNGMGMQPMKFVTKVTQRLRTMDKR